MANPPKPLSPKQVERLNAPSTGTAIKWMSRIQTWVFKKTGGRFGDKFLRGAAVGILTTMGRKSGEPRESPLLYLQEGRRIVLVASQGGRATNPMWYLNLTANPEITFQTADRAEGIWAMEGMSFWRQGGMEHWFQAFGHYFETYEYREGR